MYRRRSARPYQVFNNHTITLCRDRPSVEGVDNTKLRYVAAFMPMPTGRTPYRSALACADIAGQSVHMITTWN